MIRRFLISLVIFLVFALSSFSQNVNADNRLRDIVRQYGQAGVTIPYTDNKSLDLITRNVSILSVKDKRIYISLSPLTIEWFILQKYPYQITESTGSKGIVTARNVNEAMDWETYPTYTQYDSIMQSFISMYPSFCKLDTIGTSVNGKLVLALKISDNAAVQEDEPQVFYSSTIHGDETGGYILMLRLADYLLKNYYLDPRMKDLVDNLQIWINPLANPDGMYNTGNAINSPVRYNANGIDLNRNFPDPITPNTISEKETLDMIKFSRKHRFVLSANFHAGAELVNYPWDRWLSKLHPDNDWFYNISRAYADTVHSYSNPAYMNVFDNGVIRGAVWYLVYGGRQDFLTSELQGREVTIELDDQFITPTAQLNLLWENNWHSLVGFLENAFYGIHGLVRDSETSVPVPARIFIAGHDTDSSHVYSDTLTGSFVRFLSPGTWNLTFSAKGYNDLTINNIFVVASQKTEIVANMIPLSDVPDSTLIIKPSLYPNPATNDINAVLPEEITGQINIKIISHSGKIMSDFNTEVVKETPVPISLRGLAGGTYSIVFKNLINGKVCIGRFVVIK
jgi:murein tripeptide amidase MpaA